MKESDEIRQYLDQSFGAVDKLNQTDLEVSNAILAIMLLYNLSTVT